MSDEDDGKVIAVDFAQEREVTTSVHVHSKSRAYVRSLSLCRHPNVLIDEDTLELECKHCQAPVDARRFVLEWALERRRFDWDEREVLKLREEAERLKHEIKNLKAQRRRAERVP